MEIMNLQTFAKGILKIYTIVLNHNLLIAGIDMKSYMVGKG